MTQREQRCHEDAGPRDAALPRARAGKGGGVRRPEPLGLGDRLLADLHLVVVDEVVGALGRGALDGPWPRPCARGGLGLSSGSTTRSP